MTRKYKGTGKKSSASRAVKVSIRHLPPNITEEEVLTYFKNFINSNSFQFYSSDDFNLSTYAFSFATTSFKNNEVAIEFAKRFDGKQIKTLDGTTTNISIEVAGNEKNIFKKVPPLRENPIPSTLKLKESKIFKEFFSDETKLLNPPNFAKMLEEIEDNETKRIFGDLRETPLTKEVGVIYLTKEERGGMRIPKDKKDREKRHQERKERRQERKITKVPKKGNDGNKKNDEDNGVITIVNSNFKQQDHYNFSQSTVKNDNKSGLRSPGIILMKRGNDLVTNILQKCNDHSNERNIEKNDKLRKNIKKEKQSDKKKRTKKLVVKDNERNDNIEILLSKNENGNQEKKTSNDIKIENDTNDQIKPKRRGYVPGTIAKKFFETKQ
uniref:Smg4_UPF3 domain-containing protein n=1 Tax=Parastrongyloides trichosuri TaxID=131310 RepID=A0A0N4ZTM2_PARTI